MLIGAFLLYLDKIEWGIAIIIWGVSFVCIVLFLLIRPMNAVYGLMGTSGRIPFLFLGFIFLSICFASIYYFGFFHDAAITYDANQPHIYYNYTNNTPKERIDMTIYQKMVDGEPRRDTVYQVVNYNYQPISFGDVLKNTLLTTLMQQPTDLFSIASTYNATMEQDCLSLDRQKTSSLHWFLIIQVLISWIFFGVFISLLYNKFRYES